jgi:hypothetical protein
MGKLSSRGEAWHGNWQTRLASELKRRGFDSLRRFADESGCATYRAIASALDGPFAPIQMMMAIRSEFEREVDPAGFVADSLSRYLSEYTQAPVGHREERESQAAQALGACGAAIGDSNEEALVAVWRLLRDQILAGWLPSSPKDPTLRGAVDAAFWRFE